MLTSGINSVNTPFNGKPDIIWIPEHGYGLLRVSAASAYKVSFSNFNINAILSKKQDELDVVAECIMNIIAENKCFSAGQLNCIQARISNDGFLAATQKNANPHDVKTAEEWKKMIDILNRVNPAPIIPTSSQHSEMHHVPHACCHNVQSIPQNDSKTHSASNPHQQSSSVTSSSVPNHTEDLTEDENGPRVEDVTDQLQSEEEQRRRRDVQNQSQNSYEVEDPREKQLTMLLLNSKTQREKQLTMLLHKIQVVEFI